ncbi:DUF3795 domain-containing protein [Lutispora sp.]|uniref:DUF3795 domain-containing protein n=1 Tax=Lutispora sp. TaxID=2828727 RepID=UPI000ED3AD63|nr:DUF3795 domain-containing protein [Lutispora sp.]MEA4963743.1 DUF3795 domain-containing protein [Lutispora sp.]HCJ57812.1 hypothetical protein [Clostridiaceae bacterium]
MNYKLLGVCGLYCGACNHYQASLPQNAHLLQELLQKDKTVEEPTCQGCRSDRLYSHCSECKIRECTEDKGADHCGDCTEAPCEMLRNFQSDGRAHHLDVMQNLAELKEQGCEEWLKKQELKWKCQCGASHSWYEAECHLCGSPFDFYYK